jgi:hypothetical protein
MNWFAEADATTALLAVVVLAAALGFLVNHWAAVLAPPVALVTYYLGLWQNAWGNGVGDFWWALMIILAALGSAASALGIGVRRLASARTGSRPSEA